MISTALRLYGKEDLRLESFQLPEIRDDEILAEVVTDSLCLSSYKAWVLGQDHKKIPADIATKPVIIGHEFAGRLLQVGEKWQHKYQAGQKFAIQPALNYKGSLDAPGYSFEFIGGDATKIIIPSPVMEMDCLLPYEGEAYFLASLCEPVSCVVGACHAQYHTKPGSYEHEMGIAKGGKCALLASAGPMGLAAIDYIVNGPPQPALLVVTDINQERLNRAARIFTKEAAAEKGIELHYLNTSDGSAVDSLLAHSGKDAYDDVFVFAANESLIEEADAILGQSGCLNFFAGPVDADFKARINLYNVHYVGTHFVGTSGGNAADMHEALELISDGRLNPAAMITHVGGLTAALDATPKLHKLPGAKKLIYTHMDMPLTAIEDFADLGKHDPFYAGLAEICQSNDNIWNLEAERYILAHGERIKESPNG